MNTLAEKIIQKGKNYGCLITPNQPFSFRGINLKEYHTLSFHLQAPKLDHNDLLKLLFTPGIMEFASIDLEDPRCLHVIYQDLQRIDWYIEITNFTPELQSLWEHHQDVDTRIWYLFDACLRFFRQPTIIENYLDQIEEEILNYQLGQKVDFKSLTLHERLSELLGFYSHLISKNGSGLVVSENFLWSCFDRLESVLEPLVKPS